MEKHWIKLLVTANPIRAEIIKQMLEEHQVPAVVINKQDSSYRFGQIEVYVHESQEPLAQELLANSEFDTPEEE